MSEYLQPIKSRCQTTFVKGALPEIKSLALFDHLMIMLDGLWQDGIKSRNGFTRKAISIDMGDIPEVDEAIFEVLPLTTKQNYIMLGIYLNRYDNGQMYTPNHSHKGTHQLVISLGGTRTLNVAKKSYKMETGDAIIFGSSTHGVPKDDSTETRISIATFMKAYTIPETIRVEVADDDSDEH